MPWVYIWTSKLKCAYVWTTPVKCIYVWTTKVRPSDPSIVDFALIWWWWGGGYTSGWYPWWWWGGGQVIICSNFSLQPWDYCVIVWEWGCGMMCSCNWGDTKFNWITAYWWGAWWPTERNGCNWWNWWWGWGSWSGTIHRGWCWCSWFNWGSGSHYAGAWWGAWAWGSWCSSSQTRGGLWGSCTNVRLTCNCSMGNFAGGWGWWWCSWGAAFSWGWGWAWGPRQKDWCSATGIWGWWGWGWWGWTRNWWNWWWGAFILTYRCDCNYNISWGTKSLCGVVCVHCFTSDWTLTVS